MKWGVIAAGGIADRRMIPAMMESPGVQLVAVMDADAGVSRRVAEKYGVANWYATERELLAHQEIEAVYIASPVYCHKEQVFRCADAGKHILLEKPIAMNAGEARELADYCKEKKVKLAAGYNMRFATLNRQIKKLLDEGQIGQLVSLDARFTCWYPEIPGAWRQRKDQSGGGAMMDMGMHLIDLTQYLSGSRIISVAAMNERQRFSYEVEDSSSLLVRFDNGMTGHINSNFNIPDSAAQWQITFFGTLGRIIGDTTIGQEDGGRLLVIREAEEKTYDAQQDVSVAVEEEITGEFGNLYRFELESFMDSVENDKPLVCDAEQAVYDHVVADAAYQSSATGRIVNIK